MKKLLLGAALAVASVSIPAHAGSEDELEETAARFGARQSVLDISLSPSGDKIAFIGPGPNSSEILNIVDLKGEAKITPVLQNSEENADLVSCVWATEERLVCSFDVVSNSAGTLIGYSRLIAFGDDGQDAVMLTPRTTSRSLGIRQDGGSILALDVPDKDRHVLMTKAFVPERTTGTRLASDLSGLGVEVVDVKNGRRSRVEQPDNEAVAYLADEEGRVRIKIRHPMDGNMLGNRRYYYFRDRDSSKWRLLSEVEVDAQSRIGFAPVAVDGKRDVAYGFEVVDGYDALVEYPLAEGSAAKPILVRDDVDVDELIRIGRDRRVVGASFATEKREIRYFDPELAKFADQLAAALPGKPLINIVGANEGEGKLLIAASSDTDPGTIYLYDKASRSLQELLAVREHLVDVEMGKMTPVTFPAGDGTQIPGYLTLPAGSDGRNLPAIVLPHGGPSARDEWGFDWLVQFFTARGYAVLQPNYRGSAGYGSAWFGRNGFKAWETAIGDINDAGRWLVSQGIADPARLAVAGWSYGGYAALQSQVLDSSLYKAVVAIAPVTDLERLRSDARPYTSYALVDSFIGRGEHVKAGSPAEHAAAFASPVMLVHGTLDQNVSVGHSRMMADRLEDAGKKVDYLEFKDLDHSLSDGDARAEMLQAIDRFLKSAID